MEKFYSVAQFAVILDVHPNTIRKMIKQNRLHPINIGSDKKPTYKIPADDLLRMEAEGFKENKDVI